jgi:uncharacterized membrane protein YidH (DUF202 family)
VQRKQRSEHSFWWKPSTAQEIPNTGSIARDILATERTFLAWARTGLGFVGAGSALGAAYHREHAALAPTVLPASLLLIGNGAYLLLFATRRYWTVVAALQRDMFPIHTTGTLWAVVVTALNTVASLAIVARAEYMASAQDDGGNDVSTAQSEAKK